MKKRGQEVKWKLTNEKKKKPQARFYFNVTKCGGCVQTFEVRDTTKKKKKR